MTLTELVRFDGTVVNVRTGEALSLRDAAPEELAQAREGLAALRREVDDAGVLLDAEIVARVDAAVRAGEIDKYTVQIGDYEVRVPSPEAGGKLDVGALREDLLKRLEALNLTRDAVEHAFKVTRYTLNRSAYSTLAKQEPELGTLLKRHTGPPDRRRATVSVLPGSTGGSTPVTVAAAEGDVIEGQETFPW